MPTKTLYFDIIGRDKSGSAAIDKVGTQLLGFGVTTGAVVGLAVKKWADFDAQMSQVQTLSHATTGDMSKLSNAALTLGQNIGFTAGQVADAEIELTKAGIGVRDQLGGALVGTLNLAAAGQMDVADATQIAASAMTQFKLTGKDVPHVADLLAAGADKALGSVDDLGQGLSFVGPVAEGMGISLEQTVGTLSLFAQNGILGEKAGTGLRGVLLSLTSPSAQAAKVMDKYGISLYDAQGNFIGVDGAAQQLHDHLGGLDQATRAAAMGQIFGNQQITTATILMDGGAKSVDKWTNAVNDQGFAAEQARGKMNNLEGDTKKLGAALDTALIKQGSGADTALRNLTQTGTGLVQVFANAPTGVQQTALTIGAVTAAAAVLGGGLLILTPKIEATRQSLRRMSADGIGVGKVLGRGGALALGLTFVTGAISSFGRETALSTDQITKLDGVAKAGGIKKLNDEFSLAWGTASGFKNTLGTMFSGDFSKNGAWVNAVDHGLDTVTFGITHLGDQWDTMKAKFKELGAQLADTAKTDLGSATTQFQEYVKEAGGGKNAIDQLLQAMPAYKDALTSLAAQQGITLTQQQLYDVAVGKGTLAAQLAVPTTNDNTAALATLSGQATATTGSIDDLANSIRDFGKGQLDARSAERDFQAAIDAVTTSVQQNGHSLDIGSDKGRQNQAALDGIASSALNAAGAILTQTGSQDDATKAVEQGRAALIKALGQFGITGKAAQAYANKLGLIPGNVKTAVSLTGTNAANGLIDAWKRKIKTIPGSYLTTVGIAIDAPGLPSAYRLPGKAGGGDLDMAPGPKGVDSMFFKGAKGEHILTAGDVDAMGGQQAVYEFRKRLHRGAVPKVALAGLGGGAHASTSFAVAPAAAGGAGAAAGAGTTNVNVRVLQKVAGVKLSDLIEMQIETHDGWQTLELSSGVGR